MAARAHWKGFLKLSLVSCPVALYPAVNSAERLSFRQVSKSTGNRLRHQLVDGVTGEQVEPAEKGRGYEVAENQFVLVNDEELQAAQAEARTKSYGSPHRRPPGVPENVPRASSPARNDAEPERSETPPVSKPLKVENTRTIEIERFVPRSQIDTRYHNTPYYITPRDVMGQEAFSVIRDAMAGRGVVGMGHVVLASRERPIIVEARGKGLLGTTLRYAHELRAEEEFFSGIPEFDLPKQMLGVADHIVEAMLADFDPAHLEDRYRTVLLSMLREKKRQMPTHAPTGSGAHSNVVKLMDVLKRSLAAQRPPPAKARPATLAPKRPARRTR
jgi:non-homologous end joining protein Ku